MTEAQATILARLAAGGTLTQSMLGERLWSLLEDPFMVFDDVSPRVLLASGLIALAQRGSVKADRASAYRLTSAGQAALWMALARALTKEPPRVAAGGPSLGRKRPRMASHPYKRCIPGEVAIYTHSCCVSSASILRVDAIAG